MASTSKSDPAPRRSNASRSAPRAGGSRIPNFFRMSVTERIDALHSRGYLSSEDVSMLNGAGPTLRLPIADKMIENVVGVFGLPLGVALNFMVNGRDYVLPLVVEEASIVAGLSGVGRITRLSGGFSAHATESILIGQVQVTGITDSAKAKSALMERREDLLALANGLHPNMVARGGGARDVEVHVHAGSTGEPMVVLHLLVDTQRSNGSEPGQFHVRRHCPPCRVDHRWRGIAAHPVESHGPVSRHRLRANTRPESGRQGVFRRAGTGPHRAGQRPRSGGSLPGDYAQQGNHERRGRAGAGHRQRLAGH